MSRCMSTGTLEREMQKVLHHSEAETAVETVTSSSAAGFHDSSKGLITDPSDYIIKQNWASASTFPLSDGSDNGYVLCAEDTTHHRLGDAGLRMHIMLAETMSMFHHKISVVEAEVPVNRELDEAREKLQSLTEVLELKRMFVRDVGHEIRTPLTVVMSGLTLLEAEHGQDNPKMKWLLDAIRFSCSVSIELLNDLLTYEKLESKILVLDKTDCDLVQIVQDVVDQFSVQAIASDISLCFHMTPVLQIIVSADRKKVSQVTRNLVSNALKFTPSGGTVVINVKLVEGGFARVDVTDSGAGISHENQAKLFSNIIQFSPQLLQGGQGTGLGLYMSKGVMDLHGGYIGVESAGLDSGSSFFISMPVLAVYEVHQGSGCSRVCSELLEDVDPVGAPARQLRVLVADDAVLCRKFLARSIKPYCLECIEAKDGIQAIELIKDYGARGEPFDAVFMDSSMPHMDGGAATFALRAWGFLGKIYGVTGNAQPEDIDAFVALGADEVFVKPIAMSDVLRVLT